MALLTDRHRRPVIAYRVAMGRPGRPPRQLDYFEITRPAMVGDNYPVDVDAHAEIGDKPRRLKILVDSDHLEDFVDQQYEARIKKDDGTKIFCRGDGCTARRWMGGETDDITEIPCRPTPRREDGTGFIQLSPKQLAWSNTNEFSERNKPQVTGNRSEHRCPFSQNSPGNKEGWPVCKPRTEVLFTLIDAPRVGARARFRSSGHRTADAIVSSLLDIKAVTGELLAGVPLALCLERVSMERPGGKKATHSVAHVELDVPAEQALALAVAGHRTKAELLLQAREVRGLLGGTSLTDDATEFDPEIITEVGSTVAAAEKPSLTTK